MEEKQRELEKRKVVKSSTNYVSTEDMKKKVAKEIKTKLQEKKAEEKARKERRNNTIIFRIKENEATNQRDK